MSARRLAGQAKEAEAQGQKAMTDQPITFTAKWTPRLKCYIEVLKGDVVIATSKQAYGDLEAGISATRSALDALAQGNDQLFAETFIRS
jgi:hypothetical protein